MRTFHPKQHLTRIENLTRARGYPARTGVPRAIFHMGGWSRTTSEALDWLNIVRNYAGSLEDRISRMNMLIGLLAGSLISAPDIQPYEEEFLEAVIAECEKYPA